MMVGMKANVIIMPRNKGYHTTFNNEQNVYFVVRQMSVLCPDYYISPFYAVGWYRP